MDKSNEGVPSRLKPVSVKERKVVYRGWSTLEVIIFAAFAHGREVNLRREVHDHGHGAAVLAYDPVARRAVLVRQIRAGAFVVDGSGLSLEAIAGLIDAGEDGETTVRREAWEEAGVVLGKVAYLGSPFSTPGAVTERIGLYLGEIDPAAPRGKGGGLAAENEEIEVVEMPLAELAALADAGGVHDLKTFCLLEALRRRRPELFA